MCSLEPIYRIVVSMWKQPTFIKKNECLTNDWLNALIFYIYLSKKTVKMLMFLIPCLVFLSTIRVSHTTALNNKELQFLIEHENGGVFTSRSTAQIAYKSDNKQVLSFSDRNGIYEENIMHFKQLLNRNELYKLRIRSSDSEDSVPSVIVSIPAV